MDKRRTMAAALLALGLMAASGALAGYSTKMTWSPVTVTLVDGWTYETEGLAWQEDGESLLLKRSDGAVKTLDASRVTRVLDAEGQDITAEVAGARPGGARADGPAAAAGDEPARVFDEFGAAESGTSVYRLTDPPLFGFAFDAGLGYGLPAGDWFRGLESGLNAQLGVRASVGERQYVHLLFRHQDLGQYTMAFDDGYGGILSVDFDTSLHQFLLMFGTHTRPQRARTRPSCGYFEAGFGLHRLRVSALGESESMDDLALAFQAGVLAAIGDRTFVDLGVSASNKPGWSSEREGGGTILAVHGALVIGY